MDNVQDIQCNFKDNSSKQGVRQHFVESMLKSIRLARKRKRPQSRLESWKSVDESCVIDGFQFEVHEIRLMLLESMQLDEITKD